MKNKEIDKGYIERRTIKGTSYTDKYFLIVVSNTTNKVVSSFGVFNTEQEAVNFAKVHSISLE